MSKYDSVFICGYCGHKTLITDDKTESILENGYMPEDVCKCGHFSYFSSIRCKMLVNTKDWRMAVGYSPDIKQLEG